MIVILRLLSFILQSVLRQVHSLFQSEFSTGYDLVLRLSVSSILSFPQGHPVAACVFFLISRQFCPSPYIRFRRQLLGKMCPSSLVLCVWYFCSPWLYVTLHFSHDLSNITSSFFSTIFHNLPDITDLLSEVSKSQITYIHSIQTGLLQSWKSQTYHISCIVNMLSYSHFYRTKVQTSNEVSRRKKNGQYPHIKLPLNDWATSTYKFSFN